MQTTKYKQFNIPIVNVGRKKGLLQEEGLLQEDSRGRSTSKQSGVMGKGVLQETKKETPQGGNLSPLLSNVMLNELDRELEKRGLNFVRYADDCLIMVKSEKTANRVMESITHL